MKLYLAGAVTHDPNCNDWREDLIRKLPNHGFVNPVSDENSSKQLKDFMASMKKEADTATAPKTMLMPVRAIMSTVIPKDLALIDECDGVVCYLKKGFRVFGTICEMFYAYQKGKPIYLVTDAALYAELNDWEIGMATEIWFTICGLISFLSPVLPAGLEIDGITTDEGKPEKLTAAEKREEGIRAVQEEIGKFMREAGHTEYITVDF